jgi:hypothetical protein
MWYRCLQRVLIPVGRRYEGVVELKVESIPIHRQSPNFQFHEIGTGSGS